jgi:hypothetical protein
MDSKMDLGISQSSVKYTVAVEEGKYVRMITLLVTDRKVKD